jgi:Coenzyme PQQ synthesis protein D (PqqD)
MTAQHLGVAASTAWVEQGDTVYAAPLPDGPPFVLAGPGAVIWQALVGGGTLEEVTQRVADGVGSPAELVAADVATFIAGLVDAGLVDCRTAPTTGAVTTHD